MLSAYCVCAVFYLFFSPVSNVAWLVMMMFTAVLALLACGLLIHLLSFHVYISKDAFTEL